MDKLFSRKIVFFNFLFSILMVAFHANADVHFDNIISNGSIADTMAGIINGIFNGFDGTHFFMVMSAFLLYRNLSEENLKDKLARRVKTLVIPWILWNLIGMVSYHDFDKGLWYLVRYFVTSRFCDQLWFVETLIVLLAFAPVFKRIFKVKYVREIVLVITFVVNYVMEPMLRETTVFPSALLRSETVRVFEHIPTYCLGVYLGLNHADCIISERYNGRYRILSLLAALAIVFLPLALPDCLITSVAGRMKFAALWIILSKKYFVFEPRWWMQISFYTYAIHNFVLYWEAKIIKVSGLFGPQFAASSVTESFAAAWRMGLAIVAILMIGISARLLMRFVPRFYELLSGGRVPDKSYA